jgi:hypothetical protein
VQCHSISDVDRDEAKKDAAVSHRRERCRGDDATKEADG